MRIIIDMDDVLADASSKILSIFNQINKKNLEPSFFANKSFYDYVDSPNFKPYINYIYEPGFFSDLKVFPNAQEVVKELAEKHEVFVVSAATEFPNSLKEKYDWIKEHFPFISWRNFVLCGDKSIIKGDIMIDDHDKNLKTFKGEKILFDALHNKLVNDYLRLNNWLEIHKYFFK